MRSAGLKYIFYAGSLLLLVAMLILSRDAGISCDEVLHYGQSIAVRNYFSSHGTDQSALNTPVTNLKYYGQSYDNIVTFLADYFEIRDIYSFRHLMSTLAGWLAVFITALFAVWLSGYRTAILVVVLFAVSPTFMGHAQNNLKDIPFALSYISGTFFALKFIFSDKKFSIPDIIFLTLSIAFAISIRSGGLILICYLFFFFIISVAGKKIKTGNLDFSRNTRRLAILAGVSVVAYFLGILLWPFALQAPIDNVIESYKIMAHFPSTFRQVFEGNVIWSDYMPWYYLPKSMAITIPLIVTTGFLLFLVMSKQTFKTGKVLIYSLLVFTIVFPVSFVLFEKSNLYSSWRQFLFLYPSIVLLAAAGVNHLFGILKSSISRWVVTAIIIALTIHPVLFMIKNPKYHYLYYNQLAGGLKGAYGNYETDYYYISQTEASVWLLQYFENNRIDSAMVMASFSVDWQFRNNPGISTGYSRNEEMSMKDWDFAIITNRYIHPYKLKKDLWPPEDAIHIINADNIPVCAVVKRKSKADYQGFRALENGNNPAAISFFREALKEDDKDEMIFYNFARALYNNGDYQRADSVLKAGLEINPDFDLILMYLGNIAAYNKNNTLALEYYARVIRANRKYFQAYVESAKLLTESDVKRAREMLRSCLDLNPEYKPAITGLADTYRKTEPEIAEKYDKIAATIK